MAAASNVTTYNPWATASPYLTDILGQAQGLYNSQAPLYTNPSANFGFGQATGAVGNALGGTTTLGGMASQISPIAGGNISSQFANPFGTTGNLDATGAIQQELSGTPDYSAVKGALDAADTQQWNQFYNQVVPQLNQRASFLGNPSGAIKDLNSSITQIGQNQNLNAQQAYLGQYNLAKQQQQAASSLVANGGLQGQSNALGLGALGGQLAGQQGAQSLTAAQLFPGISTLPQQNLADYSSIVGNTTGKYGTGSQTTTPGSAQNLTNILGGLTAGAGLLGTLFGSNDSAGGSGVSGVSGLTGMLGKLFGGNTLVSSQYSNPLDPFGSGYYGMVNDPSMTNFSSLSGADPNSSLYDPGTINWGDDSGGFSGAGGQAAAAGDGMTASNFQSTGIAPSFDAYQATAPDSSPASPSMGSIGAGGTGSVDNLYNSVGNAAGTAGGLYGIASGLNSGTPTGDASAAVGATQLANKAGAFGSYSGDVSTGLGAAGSALGLYGGIKEGGVAGDTQAGLSAASLAAPIATAAGATTLGTTLAAAGPVGLALAPALYGMSTPAVQLTQKYWGGVQNSLQQAIASGDRGQIAAQVQGLLSQPQSQIPANIQQLVYSTGFVPSTGWGLQTMTPAQQQALVQQTGGFKGGNSGGGAISVGRH